MKAVGALGKAAYGFIFAPRGAKINKKYKIRNNK